MALALLAAAVGCQSVDSELAKKLGSLPESPGEAPAAPKAEVAKFQVEVRESGKQPELKQFPLPQTLYVQQVLDQSGVLRRFRRLKIEIYRQLPGGRGHRLDVAFDRAEHRVPPGADYAIHPNDRIVITEDTSTLLDDMLESLSGPFK
jgi:hypothetical protein